MSKRDFYEALGISRHASKEDIKKAYRKLAKEYHPDRNPGDAASEQRFKEVNEAYDILKDDQKRAAYDQYGHAAFEGVGPGARHAGFEFTSAFSDIFEDLFGDFTGARRRGAAHNRGSDLRYNLEITLEEAFAGVKETIEVPTTVACEACAGSGAAVGSSPITCPTCGGHGRVRAQQGFFTIERTCPTCQGQGQSIGEPCTSCHGAGRTAKERTLQVSIPKGVDTGTRIRLAGEGEAGLRGGPPGDLYIFVTVLPHPLFERDGRDIFCRVPISMAQAALGTQLEVPTLGGSIARMTIPEGTQTGRQFRLRSKGMPDVQTGRQGDMYVSILVETPVNLTSEQKDLLAQFEEAGDGRHNPETEGFFAKVKGLWDNLTE